MDSNDTGLMAWIVFLIAVCLCVGMTQYHYRMMAGVQPVEAVK